MNKQQTEEIIRILISKDVNFESGLTDDETLKIELKFNIKFPSDYKLFLQTALPVSESFVNWREGLYSTETMTKIFSKLAWPLDGLLFDLQSNDFRIDAWGNMPDSYDEKELIAKQHYATYPKLIPIYSHRYIPSQPNENGNPVFSIHQMDIIYYGYDLATYLANEFHFALPISVLVYLINLYEKSNFGVIGSIIINGIKHLFNMGLEHQKCFYCTLNRLF